MFKDFKFIYRQIVKNHKRFIKTKIGRHTSFAGATHKSISITDSIQYIQTVFNDYVTYGGLNPQEIKDKVVLEIGPGDNFGVGLLFLVHGAKKVYLLDKFYSERDQEQQIKIYKNLRTTLTNEQQQVFDRLVSFSENELKIDQSKLEYIYGYGVEEQKNKLPKHYIDIIVSRAVIQEISNTTKVFQKMHNLLKTGGMMLHKIDLRDYGVFRTYKKHALGALHFNALAYKLMTNHSGLPNRKRVNHYKTLLDTFKFKSTIYISHIFGEVEKEFDPHKPNLKEGVDYTQKDIDYIEKNRPYLAKEFQNLSVEDLLISGIFIKGIK